MKKKVTIKDVAARCGYSVTTVSHVINKTRFVEETTRRKVLKAIEELGYKPNIIARSLKGKGSKTIGLIISDIREGFFSEIIKSIETTAFKEGYNVILCDSEEKVNEEKFYIDVLLQKGIDGLILSPVDSNAEFEDLLRHRIPIVQIDRMMSSLKTDFVGIDNLSSSRKAVQHLIAEGYKNIGFIGFEERVYTMNKRKEGYLQGIKDSGLSPYVLHIPYAIDKYENLITDWIDKNSKIDSIVCGNENICYGVLNAAKKLNLIIPYDLGIVSFDDPKWFQFVYAPITAIAQPTDEIGRTAVKLLKERIENREAEEKSELKTIFLEAPLKVRRSSIKSS